MDSLPAFYYLLLPTATSAVFLYIDTYILGAFFKGEFYTQVHIGEEDDGVSVEVTAGRLLGVYHTLRGRSRRAID